MLLAHVNLERLLVLVVPVALRTLQRLARVARRDRSTAVETCRVQDQLAATDRIEGLWLPEGCRGTPHNRSTYRGHSTPIGRPLMCSGQAPIVKLAATGVVGDNVTVCPTVAPDDEVDEADGGVIVCV